MPQPHEQKLHEVENSATSESFSSRAATFTAVQSSRPPTARPAPPPTVSFNTSLRETFASLGSLMGGSPLASGRTMRERLLQALHVGDERVEVGGRQAAVLGRHRRLLGGTRLLGHVDGMR